MRLTLAAAAAALLLLPAAAGAQTGKSPQLLRVGLQSMLKPPERRSVG